MCSSGVIGGMAPAALAAAGTSTPLTGCVEQKEAPSTWHVSPAPPASASSLLERSVAF